MFVNGFSDLFIFSPFYLELNYSIPFCSILVYFVLCALFFFSDK